MGILAAKAKEGLIAADRAAAGEIERAILRPFSERDDGGRDVGGVACVLNQTDVLNVTTESCA